MVPHSPIGCFRFKNEAHVVDATINNKDLVLHQHPIAMADDSVSCSYHCSSPSSFTHFV